MDLRKIKKLIELLEESELTELEVREGEESIRLSRLGTPVPVAAPAALPVAAAPATPAPDAGSDAAGVQDASPAPTGHVIKSPMVGSYYASASPETPPFVDVGTEVKEGDTLCIIEAMKIFNQIESDRAGTVRAVFKESGDPVEYGEVLFIID